MPLITLTTDYGIKDFYVSALKAKLYNHFTNVTLVDISHLVPPFDVIQGSLMFRAVWQEFPKDTIHIIDIDNAGGNKNLLIIDFENQYFVMPDNGLISLIFSDNSLLKIYTLDYEADTLKGNQFSSLLILAVQKILNNLDGLALISLYEKSITYQPVYTADTIHASVIYIDNYRNVILNVDQKLFENLRQGRAFEIIFKKYCVSIIHQNYDQVKENEICCFFNSADLLEISMNKSKAADLLGLSLDNEVLIDFKN